MPINAELFRKIADVIEDHPDNYDQAVWVELNGEVDTSDTNNVPHVPAGEFACSARCCIAGFAVMLTPVDQRPKRLGVSDAARQLLGITGYDACRLFSIGFNPVGMSVSQALRQIADTGKMIW